MIPMFCVISAINMSVVIIGGGTGALALLVLLVLCIDFIRYRHRKSRGNEALQKQKSTRRQGRPSAFYGNGPPAESPTPSNAQLVLLNTDNVCESGIYGLPKPPHKLAPLDLEEKKTKKKKKKSVDESDKSDYIEGKSKKKGNKRKITPANSIEDNDSSISDAQGKSTYPPVQITQKKKKKKDYHTLEEESKKIYVIDDKYKPLPPPPSLQGTFDWTGQIDV